MHHSYSPLDDPFDEGYVDDLHALFEGEWWSIGRTREEVVDITRNSQVCVGDVDDATGKLVSFARVVTDYRTFAVILDVIVAPDARGQGLGVRLLEMILSHPSLQELRGIGLQCEEQLMPFYERWGFSSATGRSIQMKRSFDRAVGERPADAVQVRST